MGVDEVLRAAKWRGHWRQVPASSRSLQQSNQRTVRSDDLDPRRASNQRRNEADIAARDDPHDRLAEDGDARCNRVLAVAEHP